MDGEQFGGLKLTAEIAPEVIFRLNQAQESRPRRWHYGNMQSSQYWNKQRLEGSKSTSVHFPHELNWEMRCKHKTFSSCTTQKELHPCTKNRNSKSHWPPQSQWILSTFHYFSIRTRFTVLVWQNIWDSFPFGNVWYILCIMISICWRAWKTLIKSKSRQR